MSDHSQYKKNHVLVKHEQAISIDIMFHLLVTHELHMSNHSQ